MSDMSEKTADFVKDLGDAARRNPVSAALIGMGVLWLFTGGKSAGRAGDLFRSTDLDRLPGAAKDTLGNVGSGAGSVRDAASSSLATIREEGATTLDGHGILYLAEPVSFQAGVLGAADSAFRSKVLKQFFFQHPTRLNKQAAIDRLV